MAGGGVETAKAEAWGFERPPLYRSGTPPGGGERGGGGGGGGGGGAQIGERSPVGGGQAVGKGGGGRSGCRADGAAREELWRGQDSNLRRQSHGVYSATPLTAREPRRGQVRI